MSSSEANRSKHFSYLISGVIGSVTPVLALLYILALLLLYRYAQRHPRKFKTRAGLQLQRYFPSFYAFLVLSSLAEIALASWLLLQYHENANFPNVTTLTGTRLILFAASWTTATAGVYTLFFLHADWYKHPIASIGAQAVWLLLTWIAWVSSASLLNAALPSLFVGGTCFTVIYCRQMQTLFAFSVLEIMTLTIGMLIMMVLAWQSTHTPS